MGRMSRCNRLWLTVVDEVAERRLRARRPGLPPGSTAWPCWLRSVATIEQIEAAVGPKPDRSWRDEYVALQQAADRAFNKEPFPEMYEPGGDRSLSAELEFGAGDIAAAIQAGYSTDDAEAMCATQGASASTILAQKWNAHSTEFAATTHRLREVYLEAAIRAWSGGKTQPPLYVHLGKGAPTDNIGEHDGLIEFDPAWEGITSSDIGDRIEIAGCVGALEAIEGVLVEAGFRTSSADTMDSPEIWHVEDSDVVCFLPSRPPDRGGYHALVHEPSDPTSMFATDASMWGIQGPLTVTLEAISEPGEWQVRGLSVRRRLYSVSVSHG